MKWLRTLCTSVWQNNPPKYLGNKSEIPHLNYTTPFHDFGLQHQVRKPPFPNPSFPYECAHLCDNMRALMLSTHTHTQTHKHTHTHTRRLYSKGSSLLLAHTHTQTCTRTRIRAVCCRVVRFVAVCCSMSLLLQYAIIQYAEVCCTVCVWGG